MSPSLILSYVFHARILNKLYLTLTYYLWLLRCEIYLRVNATHMILTLNTKAHSLSTRSSFCEGKRATLWNVWVRGTQHGYFYTNIHGTFEGSENRMARAFNRFNIYGMETFL